MSIPPKTKCYLYFKKIYKEKILNGADPDLMNGRLVPVKILNNDKPSDINYDGAEGGRVVKANIIDTTDPWYKYEEKKWANAVILRDGVVDDYTPGQEIPESDIEAYFVWIPRYRYKLKNNEEEFNKFISIEDAGSIDSISKFYEKHANRATNSAYEIEFETKDKGVTSTTQSGQYLTHPAFVSFDTNGLWVGKFETGYNQNNSNDDVTPKDNWSAGGATHNETNADKIIIKPHVYSWRSINVSNAFYTTYEYKRELESHMMKNTEWGAVAYLTQSKYGRCDSNNTNCTEVRINNNSNYITGSSAVEEPTCGYTTSIIECNYFGGSSSLNELKNEDINNYYVQGSQYGSTTGNYSGIYDMSGGSWEYVMGVMQAQDNVATPTTGSNATNNSGFNGPYSNDNSNASKTDGKPWPSSKYYDLYDYAETDQSFRRGHLGDGTKEFGPFYQVTYTTQSIRRIIGSYNGDNAFFVSSRLPWFGRGGFFSYGTDGGLAAFNIDGGQESVHFSFRVVLTP